MPFEFCRRRSVYHGRHVMRWVILSTGFRLGVSSCWEESCEHECRDRPLKFCHPICNHVFWSELHLICGAKGRNSTYSVPNLCRCREREFYSGRRESSMHEMSLDER